MFLQVKGNFYLYHRIFTIYNKTREFMAVAKKQGFDDSAIELAQWAKALGHPARIAILKVLAEKKSCICGEIVDVLPLAQATVSQHLKALKEAGFVEGTIDGPRSCYCIDLKAFTRMGDAIKAFFDDINKQSCC